MKVYWKNHPKGLNLILQTDEMEEVNLGGVRSMPSGIKAIAVTRGYDPGRAIKGLTSIEAGQEFVALFEPWREFTNVPLSIEPDIVE